MTRFPQVRVKVDETREDEKAARVEDLRAVRGESLSHRGNRTVAQRHVEGSVASCNGVDEPAAANEEVRQALSRSPSHGRPVRRR